MEKVAAMRPFLFLVCCEAKIVSLERAFFMKRQEQIEIRECERKHEAKAGIPFLIVQMSYFDTSRSSVYSVFSVLVMRKKVEIIPQKYNQCSMELSQQQFDSTLL